MLKAIAFAILTFIMSVFKIPLSLCMDLECIMANFCGDSRVVRKKSTRLVGRKYATKSFKVSLALTTYIVLTLSY